MKTTTKAFLRLMNKFWFCGWMFVVASFHAQYVRASAVEPALLGQWPGYEHGGWVDRIEVGNGRAYLADVYGGVHILDVSNPGKPVRMGGYPYFMGGWEEDLKMVGSVAFVTPLTSTFDQYGIGLEIVDLTDAKAPKRLGGYNVFNNGGNIGGLSVIGNRVFLTGINRAEMHILDISDLSNPTLLGRYVSSNGPLMRVTVERNLAFIQSQSLPPETEGGLQIVDVSDVANPTLLSLYENGGFAVQVTNNLAYLSEGLEIVDVSNPRAPVRVSKYDTNNHTDVKIEGDLAYVSGIEVDGKGLQIVDLSDPTSPVRIGNFFTNKNISALAVKDNLLYVVNKDPFFVMNRLDIMDVSEPTAPALVGSFDESFGRSRELVVTNNLAFLADGRLRIIDVKEAAKPIQVGVYEGAEAVAVAGQLAFIVNETEGLHILDVSNPSNPARLGGVSLNGMSSVVAVGNAVYVSSSEGGMIFDVSNPAAPVQVGLIRGFGTSAVMGNRLMLAKGENDDLEGMVDIFDVSEPLNPVLLGSYEAFFPGLSGDVLGLASVGKFMVVATRTGAGPGVPFSFKTTEIVDISEPGSPVRLGSVQEAGELAVFGNAVIIGNDAGFYSIDISDPSRPAMRGPFSGERAPSIWAFWWPRAMRTEGKRFYVADMSMGLQIFEMKQRPVLQFAFETLRLGGEAGQKYVLEYNADLTSTNWSELQTITLTNSEAVIEGMAMNGKQGFYRAVTQ